MNSQTVVIHFNFDISLTVPNLTFLTILCLLIYLEGGLATRARLDYT